MTPESLDLLQSADRALVQARAILAAHVPDQAARLAYHAQFYASQALIFERLGRCGKTHKGVRHQLHQVALTEPKLPADFADGLTQAYLYKEQADYDSKNAQLTTTQQAQEAISAAMAFVALIHQVLA